MKRKILAILVATFLMATIFSAISVNAFSIEKKLDGENSPQNTDEPSGVGAFVFYMRPRIFSDLSCIIPVEGATVTLVDGAGQSHDMVYELVEPESDFYAYIAYDIPEGMCDITASKSGFDSATISVMVPPGGLDIHKLKMDKNSLSRSVHLRLIDLFPNLAPILKFLLSF